MKLIFKYLAVSFILVFFNSVSYAAKVSKVESLPTPDDVPFFDEKTEKLYLDQFEGKTILLTFWATWCAPCVKEMPDLDWLQKDFRKLPFEVIAISQDFQGMNLLKEFFKAHEIRYLKIYHDYKNQLFKAFSVVGLPSSFLINPQGKIVQSFSGFINWYDPEIREIILSHIPGNPEMPKNSYKAQDLNKMIKRNTNDINDVNGKGGLDNNLQIQISPESKVNTKPPINTETDKINTNSEEKRNDNKDREAN